MISGMPTYEVQLLLCLFKYAVKKARIGIPALKVILLATNIVITAIEIAT